MQDEQALGALRQIPYMGVIYVVAEAMKLGFWNGNPDWCNLGQGQPEVGEMAGDPSRITGIRIEPGDQAYGHINGTTALRTAVAAYYNRLYRQGKASQYTADNVSIAAGGRLVLTRIFQSLRRGRLGYQVPDYTAYEDMMNSVAHRVEPILVPTDIENGFAATPRQLREAIEREGLTSYLVSNPCNPTGRVVRGDELAGYVETARDTGCTLILDEFYSHFIYDEDGSPGAGGVSAAALVDDVDIDPILLVDGLTKNFRYPGWRIGWAVGPRAMIETLGRAASAIDGGPNQPLQRAALQVLDPAYTDQATHALRQVFSAKRNLMVGRLKELGMTFARETEGTFYCWANIAALPEPLNDGEVLFRRALERKVMTVPGVFFDVNPGAQRTDSPWRQWVRFSFGPDIDNVRMGLDRLTEMVREA
jgi:aspartate/methionine/tyrosine aminotransferase